MQHFAHRLSRCHKPGTAIAQLVISLSFLSGCAAVAPEIDSSLRQKALEGDIQAQYEIGCKYDESAHWGWGNWQLLDEAADWYAMAANQGDARAQYRLANFYFSSRQDYVQSFRLNQRAAQQGLAEAQYSLGMQYAQAWGTEQNLVLAYKWIALANEGGVKGGRLADTDWLIWKAKLSREQIAEGIRLASEHTAEFGKSRSIWEMN